MSVSSSQDLLYWLAVNGPSFALSPRPLPRTVQVEPVPEMLVGFNTAEEAQEHQQFLLTAPAKEMHKRLADLRYRRVPREVMVIRPENREPPAREGETHWMAGEEKVRQEMEEQELRVMVDGHELIIKLMEVTKELAENG